MTGRFQGRRAIVTGAGRGIGPAIAERLAAEGADVVITARTLDHHDHLAGTLNETLSRCRAYGGVVDVVAADLADPVDRARIVPEAVTLLGGPIDILVNNAAAGIHNPMAEFPLRRRQIMFEVNLQAPLDLAQAVIPAMRDAGEGWILNLSSGGARLVEGPPFPSSALGTTNGIYGATKAALNRITNALGAELYGSGIRVNTLQPKKPVATEGAIAHLGDALAPDVYAPVAVIVEAAMVLCHCPPERTGKVHVDSDLLDELGIDIPT